VNSSAQRTPKRIAVDQCLVHEWPVSSGNFTVKQIQPGADHCHIHAMVTEPARRGAIYDLGSARRIQT
jgi:hypothetical protein